MWILQIQKEHTLLIDNYKRHVLSLCWFIVNPLIRHSPTVLQVYDLITKMEKTLKKKKSNKTITNKAKKTQKQTHCVPFACCSNTTPY